MVGGVDEAVDRLAAGRGDDHARARALRGGDEAERLEVDDGLLDRHRDVIGRLVLDGGGERLRVVDRRQVERAHDDPLVGDAEPDAARQLVLGEERAQLVAEGDRIDDLAVAQDARTEVRDSAARHRDRAVDVHFRSRDVAGIQVEADGDVGVLALLLEHGLPYRQS